MQKRLNKKRRASNALKPSESSDLEGIKQISAIRSGVRAGTQEELESNLTADQIANNQVY